MFDDGELGVGEMCLVVLVLGVELLGEKGFYGLRGPATGGHFLGAGAGIEQPQKVQIASFGPTKRHRELHHERKLPCLVEPPWPGAG
ncbi:hypothetical protein D3C79_955260 [compost metagenome]